MTVFATLNQTAGCCGVSQIAEMGHHETDEMWGGEIFEAENWPELLAKIVDFEAKGMVLQVWFVDRANWDGTSSGRYDAGDLRDLVRDIPGVVSLGVFTNPNTGNFIDGYQWVNT